MSAHHMPRGETESRAHHQVAQAGGRGRPPGRPCRVPKTRWTEVPSRGWQARQSKSRGARSSRSARSADRDRRRSGGSGDGRRPSHDRGHGNPDAAAPAAAPGSEGTNRTRPRRRETVIEAPAERSDAAKRPAAEGSFLGSRRAEPTPDAASRPLPSHQNRSPVRRRGGGGKQRASPAPQRHLSPLVRRWTREQRRTVRARNRTGEYKAHILASWSWWRRKTGTRCAARSASAGSPEQAPAQPIHTPGPRGQDAAGVACREE